MIGPEPDMKDEKSPEKPIRIVEGLSLIIGNDDGSIDNADVRVRWCVTPELTKSLIDQNVHNPHVLVLTFHPSGKTEWREIFPMNEVMSFARFYQPGEMKIAAYIIDLPGTPANIRRRKDNLLCYGDNSYRYHMQIEGRLQYTPSPTDYDSHDFYAGTEETVIIPKGVFDREAPAWLEWYVNMWHGRGGPEDSCGFRGRFIIGLFKWIPMAIVMLLFYFFSAILLAVTWLTGYQHWIISYHPLKHPFVPESFFSMHDNDEGEHGNLLDSKFIGWWTWPQGIRQPLFAPFVLAPLWPMLLFLLGHAGSDHNGILAFHDGYEVAAYGTLFLFTLLMVIDLCVAFGNAMELVVLKRTSRERKEMAIDGVIVFVAVFIIFMVVTLTSIEPMFLLLFVGMVMGTLIGSWLYNKPWVSGAIDKYFDALDRFYDKIVSIFRTRDDYTEMRELLCPKDLENLSTNMNSLPSRNRSWRLMFKNVKASVCKPRVRRS